MVVMGLFLIAVGSLFVWYLWAFFQKSSRMNDWVETPCVIEKSEIDSSGLNQHYGTMYALVTEYRYQFDGTEYTGTKYKRIQPASSHEDKIESKRKDYPVGSEAVCYVNPEEPSTAVLKKDSKASIYSIWFPGLFVLGGLGMVVSALRKR